jgi:hypothetical protein
VYLEDRVYRFCVIVLGILYVVFIKVKNTVQNHSFENCYLIAAGMVLKTLSYEYIIVKTYINILF